MAQGIDTVPRLKGTGIRKGHPLITQPARGHSVLKFPDFVFRHTASNDIISEAFFYILLDFLAERRKLWCEYAAGNVTRVAHMALPLCPLLRASCLFSFSSDPLLIALVDWWLPQSSDILFPAKRSILLSGFFIFPILCHRRNYRQGKRCGQQQYKTNDCAEHLFVFHIQFLLIAFPGTKSRFWSGV